MTVNTLAWVGRRVLVSRKWQLARSIVESVRKSGEP
jgi:hypothetical protein